MESAHDEHAIRTAASGPGTGNDQWKQPEALPSSNQHEQDGGKQWDDVRNGLPPIGIPKIKKKFFLKRKKRKENLGGGREEIERKIKVLNNLTIT